MLCMRGHKDMGCFNPRSWLSTVHRVPRYPKTLTLSTPPWMVQAVCSIPHAPRGTGVGVSRAAASDLPKGGVQKYLAV